MPRMTRFGPLTIGINDELLRRVPEMASFPEIEQPAVDRSAPDLTLEAVEPNQLPDIHPTHFVGKGALDFSRSAFVVRSNRDFTYALENPFDLGSPMRVTVAFKAPRLGPRARLRRALLASAEDPKSGIFIPNAAASYSLLWYVITLSLARKSATFVHGAAFEQNGKAVLLAGSGGCGKTSTLLLALKQPNTRYLAEDFATLSTDGDVYYTPKTVTLYRSDVEASSLQNPGVNSSSFRRFAFLTRDKNPKLKVSPNALVGSSLGTRCPLGLACMLVRTDASNFSLNPISVDELSWRIAQASMRELKPLAEILQMLSANAPHDYGFPSATDLEKRMLDTYHAVFSKADARLLVIPHKQPPSELIKFLQAEKVLSA